MAVRKGMPAVVRRICLWCQGGSWKLVRECVDNPCPLYPWRMAENGEDGVLRTRIAAFCLSCAGSNEGVAECSADMPIGGQPVCPAHPYRIPSDSPEEGCAAPELSAESIQGALPTTVSPPVTAVQQVRLLPGLGEACVKSGVRPLDEVRCETLPPSRDGDIPPALSLPEALAGLNYERAPKALDI